MKLRLLKTVLVTLSFVWVTNAFAVISIEQYENLVKSMSQSKQQEMTPKDALQLLKDGNKRFLTNTMKTRDYPRQAKQSSYGQFPFAVVLNCMDSRSVPELIFDQGLADLFTIRVAGNVLNDDNLGSMEFATKVTGARLIVILAHTSCGAVAGACDEVKLGHITDILDKIQPVVKPAMQELGTKDCSKPELINNIAKLNALQIARDVQARSPILKQLIDSKQIGIVVGMHDIRTGEVHFYDEERLVP